MSHREADELHRKQYWLTPSRYRATGRFLRKDIEISVHADERIEKRVAQGEVCYTDLVKHASEVWARQRGPDPAWKVPRVSSRYRYLGHGGYCYIFEVIRRELEGKVPLKRLITVVGPFSEGQTWETYKQAHNLEQYE